MKIPLRLKACRQRLKNSSYLQAGHLFVETWQQDKSKKENDE
jgi:hypothetical protein